MKPGTEEPVVSVPENQEDKEVLESQLKALEDVSTEIQEQENIEEKEVVADEDAIARPVKETISKGEETGEKISEKVTPENLPAEKDLPGEQKAQEIHPEKKEVFPPATTPVPPEKPPSIPPSILPEEPQPREEQPSNKSVFETGWPKDFTGPVLPTAPKIFPEISKKPGPEPTKKPVIKKTQKFEEQGEEQGIVREQKSGLFRVVLIVALILPILVGGAFVYVQFFGIPNQLSFLKQLSFLEQIPFLKITKEPPVVVPTPSPLPSPASGPEPAEPVLTPEEERDNQRISDLNTLRDQLSLYYEAVGSYPVTDGTERILPSTVEDSALYQALVPGYLIVLPVDPDLGFYYGYSSDGTSYELTSILENQNSPECVLAGTYCIRKIKDGEVVSVK